MRLSTTPGTTSCSKPLYSPSVFSLIVTKFTLSYLVLYPGMLKHGRTFANNWSSFLRVRLRDLCPFPIGVAMGPFNPIPCFCARIVTIWAHIQFTIPSWRIMHSTSDLKAAGFVVIQQYIIKLSMTWVISWESVVSWWDFLQEKEHKAEKVEDTCIGLKKRPRAQ